MSISNLEYFVRRVDDLADENARLRFQLANGATVWRPIETAPKDGTVIIAHDWHRACGGYGHDETQLVSFKGGEWFGKDSYEIHYPTHWMPLPKPPSV